jgi:hypothetical protein
MSDDVIGPSGFEPESESPANLIDAVCRRFEAAWQAGQQPRIDDFLPADLAARKPECLRSLLISLVVIDFLKTPDGQPGLNYLCSGTKRFLAYADPHFRQIATHMHGAGTIIA